MSVDDVADGVYRTLELLAATRVAVEQAAGYLGEVCDIYAVVLQGVGDPEVAQTPTLAWQAVEDIHAVHRWIETIERTLVDYLHQIGTTRAAELSTSAAPPALPSPPPPKPVRPERLERGITAARQRLGRGKPGTRASAEWVQHDGGTVRIESTPTDERYEPTWSYLLQRFGRRPARLARHVEVKIAYAMIQDDLTDETVVIDREVCGTRDYDREDPLTCDKYLPKILPSGTRLRVVQADGTIKIYEGRNDE